MPRAQRLKPTVRKEIIIEAAIELSKEFGFQQITRDQVAKKIRLTDSAIGYYFSRKELQNKILEAAIERGIVEILAQAFALNDPRIKNLNAETKAKVMEYINKL